MTGSGNKRLLWSLGLGLATILWVASGGTAEEVATTAVSAAETTPAPVVSPADTAWMLVCAALVMLMTPGLGLFYGGMVRRKNVLATFQQSFIMLGVIAVQWVLFGYSLAFGPDMLGGLSAASMGRACRGVGLDPHPTTPPRSRTSCFMVYQLMFADDHPGADLGGVRRADEVLGLSGRSRCSGRPSSTTPSPTGSGAAAAGSPSSGPSTSPAAWSSTSSRASRRSAACS